MPQLTPHGIKLAVHIIETDFGKRASEVCECLLRRGTLTMAMISRFSKLSSVKVRDCLLNLIQHNCIQAFALEQEGGARDTTLVVTQYMALFDNIIHRLRFPKFMTIASKDLDKESLEILEGLLYHGRLTFTQILDRALTSSNAGNQDTYHEKFIQLVHSRFLERCPIAEPLISLLAEGETPAKKGGGRSKIVVKEVTLEERALAAAILMDAERFSVSDDGRNETKKLRVKVGEKRKQDTRDKDIMEETKESLWRVNFDEFINHLRIKACIDYVTTQYDNDTAVIVNSMLEGIKCTENTVSLSLISLMEVIKSKGLTMSIERLRCSLQQLDFCSNDADMYCINLKDTIKKAQMEEVESIVKNRYGISEFRMFRALSNGRPLDTNKISERTFVDKKTTPKLLFKLWKDNYIQMEKVSTGGARQTDYFLWRLKKDNLWHQVLDELYHAALNLRLRYDHEVDQDREIHSFAAEKVPPEIQKRKERLIKVRFLLDSSLMKLDDAIMLFHDFLLKR
ncbi:uncharacterized protein LOC130826236 isoform X1 [Amaranthus tricolor]|uniref:uncharacterized protein LOC130826236 isoform X1 n=1 Tax=Amaranthus tricolor TaxID=29722 RepID=UPI00258983E2|nr:uncharacterized protein LOC130826236 isoform X1 [Amaranthus tricolor]